MFKTLAITLIAIVVAVPRVCASDAAPVPALQLDSSYFAAVDARVAKHHRISLYDLPYSLRTNQPDYRRLWINAGVLFGAGVATIGVLWSLPEGATAWNKEEIQGTPLFKLWWKHVKAGPEVDGDDAIFNWVLHPYAGAVYYMGARSCGCNAWYSLLYGFCISSIFWEYGFEAFMEVPSVQDLFVTPLIGSVIGEGFYLLKRHIVLNGYRLFGSKVLGNIFAFLIDPLNEVIGLFAGNECRGGLLTAREKVQMSCSPWVATTRGESSFGFSLSAAF